MSPNSKCVGPINATILNSESPGEISMRLAVFEGPFSRLKDKINIFYHKNAPSLQMSSIKPVRFGDTAAVFYDSCWCRAQIIGIHKSTFTLLLLDYAKKVENVSLSELHKLDDYFLRPNAYAFFCHLPHVCSTTGPAFHTALTDEMHRLVKDYGPDVQMVPLGPVQTMTDAAGCSVKSLPVEVIWTYEEPDNPVAPNKTKQISLSAMLNRIHFAVTEEKITDEDYFERYKDDDNLAPSAELDDIPVSATQLLYDVMSDDSAEGEECGVKEGEDSKSFRWLDPEIPAESDFRARCTHVDDYGQIYVHLYENRSTMRIIRQVLQDKYRSTGTGGKEKLEEGQECIARYKDGNWYRARVIEATEDVTRVLFVDYGNTYGVKNKYVRSGLYCKENNIQAIRVVLGNVMPWNRSEDWSEDTLDFMQEKLHYDHHEGSRVVHVKVIGSKEALPLQVTILLPPTSKNGVSIDLGDLLVNRRDAVRVDRFIPSRELLLNWKRLSYGVGFVAAGTPKIKIKIEETKNPKAKAIYSKKLFPLFDLRGVSEGDIIDVELVKVLPQHKLLVHPTVDDSGSQLSRLADQCSKMSELLQTITDQMLPIIQPREGLPVAARHPGEKAGWYRGVIQKYSPNKVLVQYVDYGPDTFWINNDQIKALPEECLSVPVAGLKLTVPLENCPQDEDDHHLGTSMMMGVLSSVGTRFLDKISLKVRITKVKPELTGHIINCNQLFQVLKLSDISEGDIIDVKLIEVLSYNKVLVHPIQDNSGSQLSLLADQYNNMMKLLQAEAEKMPPMTPSTTDGLPVAARFPTSYSAKKPMLGWFRGILQQHSQNKFKVQFVDYGPQTYWLARDQVKVLPRQCLEVPVVGLELVLPVDPASQEEDDIDLATAMMMEELYSLNSTLNDDTTFLKVKIYKGKPHLTGHIIHPRNGEPVYKRLEKEGLISIQN